MPIVSSVGIAYPDIGPVAFAIGGFEVRWYGLAYLAGFLVAWLIFRNRARKLGLGLSEDDLLTVLTVAIVGVIVGGRLGYVAVYGREALFSDPMSALRIWEGGMSFHGGLVGILLAGVWVSRAMRIPFLTLCDLASLGCPVGFGLGRLANFANGELWGRVTDVPWGIVFPGAGSAPRHPSQLYEAFLEGFVLAAVMWWLSRRDRPAGELFGWMIALYGCFRISVEFFREPDVQMGYLAAGWLTTGMVLSIPMVVAGVAIISIVRRRTAAG